MLPGCAPWDGFLRWFERVCFLLLFPATVSSSLLSWFLLSSLAWASLLSGCPARVFSLSFNLQLFFGVAPLRDGSCMCLDALAGGFLLTTRIVPLLLPTSWSGSVSLSSTPLPICSCWMTLIDLWCVVSPVGLKNSVILTILSWLTWLKRGLDYATPCSCLQCCLNDRGCFVKIRDSCILVPAVWTHEFL